MRRLIIPSEYNLTLPMTVAPEPSISSRIWQIAWPAMVMSALQTVNVFIDRKFIGMLGTDQLAAASPGSQMIFLMVTVAMSISMGTTAIVARMVGARQWDQAIKSSRQSIGLACVLAIGGTALAYVALPLLVGWYQLEPAPEKYARQFLAASLFGAPAIFLGNIVGGVFRGLGKTKPTMYAMIAMNVVHVLFAWLLIFGHLGFPRLGMFGAGLAFAISVWAMAVLQWWFLRQSELPECGDPEMPEKEWTLRTLRIGIPASMRSLIYVGGSAIFARLLAGTPEGTAAMAALPIGMTSESIAFMPGFAFAISASALVGQYLGAKDETRAERSGWIASAQACAVMTTMAVVFYVFADQFAGYFTSDPEVKRLAANYLRINAITEPLLAFGMTLAGALQGAGYTIQTALSAAFTQLALRAPVTLLLAYSLGMGANGAWWAMALSSGCSGLVMIAIFRHGGWKKAKV